MVIDQDSIESQIADHAAANIGSIAYHFGGKSGLRLACAKHVMERIRTIIGPALTAPLPPLDQAQAEQILELQVTQFGRFIASSPEAKRISAFILREVMQPGEVFDVIYAEFFRPLHMRICEVFGVATGLEATSEDVRLATFTLIGQVLYFRIGRPAVLRRMEWDDIGTAQADALVAILKKNLKGLIVAYRKES